MKVDGILMVATTIPTGIRFIPHDVPNSPHHIDVHQGDYFIEDVQGGLHPHFSAYAELIKRGVTI